MVSRNVELENRLQKIPISKNNFFSVPNWIDKEEAQSFAFMRWYIFVMYKPCTYTYTAPVFALF